MSDQTSGLDPIASCYSALLGETEADTCCKRICVMVQRMQVDNDRQTHELHLITLANQLMNETRSFGRYVVELYRHVDDGNFAAALQVGKAMIQHEAMLNEIAAGHQITKPAYLS